MLVRFRTDVIALGPEVVVILAGTNDIAGNTGPISLEDIEGNFATMVELARAHGIRVVLSSVIPVHNYTPASELTFPRRPPEQIAALNKWLKDYAATSGCVYLDYAAAMSDDKGMLRRELAEDGLHPNPAGYAIMAPLAEQAIGKALQGGMTRSRPLAPDALPASAGRGGRDACLAGTRQRHIRRMRKLCLLVCGRLVRVRVAAAAPAARRRKPTTTSRCRSRPAWRRRRRWGGTAGTSSRATSTTAFVQGHRRGDGGRAA